LLLFTLLPIASIAAHCRGRASSFVLKQKNQKFKPMERLFVAQPNPSKACYSRPRRTVSRNFLAQSFSLGGLCALLFCC
jgi:hypothetical protein